LSVISELLLYLIFSGRYALNLHPIDIRSKFPNREDATDEIYLPLVYVIS